MTRACVVPVLVLLLAGCSSEKPSRTEPNRAGAALEDAAIRSGLVDDPMTLNPVGAYASATDQVCVMRRGEGYIVGASVSYGEQQTCVARGTATATGGKTLRLDFGERCRFDARFDGKRIAFPAVLPPACDQRCTGRATFSALKVDLLSHAQVEARAMTTPAGEGLCI